MEGAGEGAGLNDDAIELSGTHLFFVRGMPMLAVGETQSTFTIFRPV